MQLVVGGVIVDNLATPTRLLAARRLRPAGRWEFPGGKVEPGEQPEAALHRELAEELGARVRLGQELRSPVGPSWPLSGELQLRLWFCELLDGEVAVAGDSHDELRWLLPADVDQVWWLDGDLAPALMVRGQLT